MPSVPTYEELQWPTLKALKAKDGSVSIRELSQQIVSDMKLSNAVLDIPRKGRSESEFEYNLAWARTYLRLYAGAVDRVSRGVWAITKEGREIRSENELHKLVRQKKSEASRVRRISDKPTDAPWSSQEISLTVAAYFDMLQMEQRDEIYVKLYKNRELQGNIGRTRQAIEYKHRNISAILQNLALPWIQGYKPGTNYQKALIAGVEHYLDEHPGLIEELCIPRSGLSEQEYLIPEPAPSRRPHEPKALTRLVRKFDPATREAENRKLGELGEKRILDSEKARLINAGRKDLAGKVKWVSDVEGDGAGYDILSFDNSGSKRLLEVKTTSGHQYTPFYLTENELQLSIKRPNEFLLVRLYNFMSSPKVFELKPPLEDAVTLQPTNYRAFL